MPYRTPSYLEQCYYILCWMLKEMLKLPYRPKIPCKQPGCPNLVQPGKQYCEEHLRLHPEVTRSAGGRGYGSRWQRESRAYLRSHPLCVECMKQGQYTKATVVDHIVPHRGDQKLFWDKNNWQALCKPHHDRETGNEDSNPTYSY